MICSDVTRTPTAAKLVVLNAILVGIVALYVCYLASLIREQSQALRRSDFASFYVASQIVLKRSASDLYDLQVQREVHTETVGDLFLRPYIHPPFEVLLFLPLGLLSFDRALQGWFALNTASLLGLPWLLRALSKRFEPKHRPIVVAGIISFYPFVFCLLNGQDSILFFWLLLGMYLCWKAEKDFWAGLLLALALIKPHLAAFFGIPLLLQKRTQSMMGFASGFAFLLMVSGSLLGASGIVRYVRVLQDVGQHVSHKGPLEPSSAGVPSSSLDPGDGFALRQFPERMHNWIGQLGDLGFDSAHSFKGAIVAAAIGTVLLLFIWRVGWTARGPQFGMHFAATILTAALASLHLYLHDLSMVFLALLLCYAFVLDQNPKELVAFVLQFLIATSLVVSFLALLQFDTRPVRVTVLWMTVLLATILGIVYRSRPPVQQPQRANA
jgi:hypothetical protein